MKSYGGNRVNVSSRSAGLGGLNSLNLHHFDSGVIGVGR